MSSLLDLFLYEISRSHQHELLESARASGALTAAEPTSLGGILRKLRRRFMRRMTPRQTAPVIDGVPQGPCSDRVFCPRLRARKDAA